MARNPKDTAISYYHHNIHLNGYTGTREDFLNAFIEGKVLFSPFNEHVLEFWKIRNQPNVLFLFYEDMKRNLQNEVRKTMKFLEKDYSDEQIDKLCDHLSVDSMRKNPSCNFEEIQMMIRNSGVIDESVDKFTFIRKGQVGSGNEELTEKENKRFDDYANHPEFEAYGFAYKS